MALQGPCTPTATAMATATPNAHLDGGPCHRVSRFYDKTEIIGIPKILYLVARCLRWTFAPVRSNAAGRGMLPRLRLPFPFSPSRVSPALPRGPRVAAGELGGAGKAAPLPVAMVGNQPRSRRPWGCPGERTAGRHSHARSDNHLVWGEGGLTAGGMGACSACVVQQPPWDERKP